MPDFKFERLPADTEPADLTGEDGYIRLLSHQDLAALPPAGVRIWAHFKTRYHLPTIGTVEWLKAYIGSRRAIEIGSGCGDLAHYLGIPGTDNMCQIIPEIAAFYQLLGQPLMMYGPDVECLDALDAVAKYQPEIVVGAWVTHWIDPKLPIPIGGGNMYGIKEDQIVNKGVTYLIIGNLRVHQHKPILKLPHTELRLDCLRSRGDPALDRVFIWNE